MSKVKTYRSCFVPLCKNTTKITPDKVFVTVPQDIKRRKQWFSLAHRDYPKSTSNYFCCEDHFDLQEDLENYWYYTTMGGPVRMKQSAIPHKFECQPNRKRLAAETPRSVAEKRRRQHEKMLFADVQSHCSRNPPDPTVQFAAKNTVLDIPNIENISVSKDSVTDSEIRSEICDITTVKVDVSTQTDYNIEQRSLGLQVNIRPKYRSIGTTCKINPSLCNTSCSPIKVYPLVNSATSPMEHVPKLKLHNDSSSTSTVVSASKVVTSSDYYESTEISHSSNADTPQKKCPDAAKLTNYFITTNMKAYLGLTSDWAFLLDGMSSEAKISVDNIRLCLMKIRRQDTFERLGEQFSMTHSNASLVFKKTIPILAHLLKTFILFPDFNKVKKILPIAFRGAYSHVQSIVDALEIQIEKPSDPVNQALTWSEYKKCNTLNYLISCSPDGFVNYISTGYGGRMSDVLLFEKCGILEKLPEKSGVMADRGFKNIQSLLTEKNCELLKPPSVSSPVQPQKSEVLETKRIASLRLHIERVIGRLREFDFL